MFSASKIVFCATLVQVSATALCQIQPPSYASTMKYNFVRTWDAVAPESDPNLLTSRPVRDVRQVTQYYDGLGRPIQKVEKQASLVSGANAVDLVTATLYDNFGRESHHYLPFAATTTGGYSTNDGNIKFNPFQQQAAFYSQQLSGQNETYYYGKTLFEASPLNRSLQIYAPGNAWVGSEANSDISQRRNIQYEYLTNQVNDSVRIWNVTGSTYFSPGNYPAGRLYKNVTTDEHKKKVVEYKDKSGMLVLKKVQVSSTPTTGHAGWLSTYYVHDDLGNLRLVIQPLGVELLMSAAWNIGAVPEVLTELSFQYHYDQRNRLVSKVVPGVGETWMVYDARDRLVMTQDPNMRLESPKKWMYTQYDELNRQVATGILQSAADRVTHQASASISTAYPNLGGFTHEELTRQFFDSYSWLTAYTTPFNSSRYTGFDNYMLAPSSSYPYPQAQIQSHMVIGLTTGSRIKILNSSQYLYSINYYDAKGRIIQTQSTNFTGNHLHHNIQYDFSGKVLRTFQTHRKGGTNDQTYYEIHKLSYDDLGRLLEDLVTYYGTVGGTNFNIQDKPVIRNEYNSLGQLRTKKMGAKPTAPTSPLAVQNFEYNIRGWLTSLNKNFLTASGNNDEYFGMQLGYHGEPVLGVFPGKQYNGNIAGVLWKSEGDQQKRKYDFSYDAVNRLTGAAFAQHVSGAGVSAVFNTTSSKLNFSVKNLTYDANGNIRTMDQYGWKINNSPLIDSLVYNYISRSNKLLNVHDRVNDTASRLGDFKTSANHAYQSKTAATEDYQYDVNGNLVKDRNKDLGTSSSSVNGIAYNHLNLPNTITFRTGAGAIKGTITYTYDAAGIKLRKVVSEVGQPDRVTLYMGQAVFENDTIQFFTHSEGRARVIPALGSSPPAFKFDYFLKDHLGNVRMVVTEEQKQHVYPAATLEGALTTSTTAAYVEKSYYSINPSFVVPQASASGITTYQNNNGNPPYNNNPNGNATANSASIYRMNSSTNKSALGITLKVMSGDKISIYGKSYFKVVGSISGGVSSLPISDLLTSFAGTAGMIGKGVTGTVLNANTALVSAITSLLAPQSGQTATQPKAHINWIFFDEQFNFAGGGFDKVGSSGVLKHHANNMISVPKNGYVYVYCSNETPHDVFFDNLQVIHDQGSIIEETHYYPFGLTMAGISSKAIGKLDNKKGFNGNELQNKEFADGTGLEFYDFNARTYDAQIGRFIQVDPLTEEGDQESLTPYQFGLDNPVRYADPDGKCPSCIIGGIIGAAVDYGTQVAGNLIQGKSFTESLTDVDGKSILSSATLGAVTSGASAFIKGGVKATVIVGVKTQQITKAQKTAVAVGNSARKAVENAKASRDARREVMRKEKIPTSQPLIPDKLTNSKDKVFLTRDKQKTVQDAKNDRGHEGKPHWEAGPAKQNNSSPDGLNRSGSNNKPQMGKPKSKVEYEIQ